MIPRKKQRHFFSSIRPICRIQALSPTFVSWTIAISCKISERSLWCYQYYRFWGCTRLSLDENKKLGDMKYSITSFAEWRRYAMQCAKLFVRILFITLPSGGEDTSIQVTPCPIYCIKEGCCFASVAALSCYLKNACGKSMCNLPIWQMALENASIFQKHWKLVIWNRG